MSYWTHPTFEDAMFACWAETDLDDGVQHCAQMILPALVAFGQPHSVLDFGCGVGRLLLPFATDNPHIKFVGVDSDAQMLTHLSEIAGRVERPFIPIQLFTAVPPDLRVDAAYSVVVFQHLPRHDLTMALDSIIRALVEGSPFRFQFVQHGDVGPHNFPCRYEEMDVMLNDAGFGAWWYESDPLFETWTWCTAVKR